NLVKKTYIEGQSFESEGLEVQSVWNNSNRDTKISENEYTLSHGVLSIGDNAVIVTVTNSYGTFTKPISITVFPKKIVPPLEIYTNPSKTSYISGEEFDATGLILKATYDNNTEGYITAGYEILNPNRPLKSDDMGVVVGYGGAEVFIDINVMDIVETPQAWPESGKYPIGSEFTLYSLTPNTTIYYTTDGSEPTISSPIYSSPVEINNAMVIKAK
ncbi:MAG: chitobiase/beta-hexosaminidase C-terminal domain-containing protein, partial [Oscillospiraceae bacterium]|nr:chitobiase/beta-hexosaminidase C-terminal domain-containing protein [Oscillospiraceae bacterium]